jgi:myosin light chain 6
MSVPAAQVEESKSVFEVYDKKYEGKVDCFYIGDMLRALNLAPSQAECEKRGQTKKTGEKSISFEDFSKVYAEFYAMPESAWGTYEDFIEGLKLYDKDQNGKLALGELCQVLSMMSEKMPMAQVEEVMKATNTVDDEDGYITYSDLVKKVMAGPKA